MLFRSDKGQELNTAFCHGQKPSAIKQIRRVKKINCGINDTLNKDIDTLILFQDERRFGRIIQPQNCWCPAGVRPSICSKLRFVRLMI